MNFVEFEVIDQNKVDGVIFKSTNHGLDADFVKLVEYAVAKMPEYKNPVMQEMNYMVSSNKTQLQVNYSNGLPVFTLK